MKEQVKKTNFTFIDLFAGCGGLSEGFYMQNFEALAHVELNHFACETLRTRMKHYDYKNADDAVLEQDITSPDINKKIAKVIGKREVDVIIGGPPCQAYSSLGRAKDENGMKLDPRNYLFESYVKILNKFKPKIFVFENVTGILTATINGEKIVNKIISALSKNYNVDFDPKVNVLNTVNYGVPQIRQRVIFIGVRKDLNLNPLDIYKNIIKTHYAPGENNSNLLKYVTVKDAIYELPKLTPGEGKKQVDFNYSLNNEFLKRIGSKTNVLFDHIARNNNELDQRRYELMAKNKWTFQELLDNKPELRHENPRLFNNSYVVQFWDYPARTIIAHLYKDGNQFIHPDYKQHRSITVREAARLQSFPDNFIFEGSRTEQYKQIGNAVPPLFAEAIAKSIKKELKTLKG